MERSHGITIVELLVSIAVISLLIALLLPAVMRAKEAARRVQCQNHLKQIGTAVLLHHDSQRHFPTGGWGYRWIGDSDRGFGTGQPGGWIYNSLPFLEQEALRKVGQGRQTPEKRLAATELLTIPIQLFYCPSRRAASTYPYEGNYPLFNANMPPLVAKSDYAVNGGDHKIKGGPGPPSLDRRASREYEWPDTSAFNGIATVRSTLRLPDVRDGASNTYLAGEKGRLRRFTGRRIGDDQSLYLGDDADIRRWTLIPPIRDSGRKATSESFGSPHPAGCQFVFCDGSVRLVAYHIAERIHQRLGNRRDGKIASLDPL